LDVTAFAIAKDLNKKIDFLETDGEQTEAIFGHMTLERVAELLESTYNNYEIQAYVYEQKLNLLEAYKLEDIRKIKEVTSDKAIMVSPALTDEEFIEMLQKTFVKGDKKFLERIEESIKVKEYAIFFIGIEHLLGTIASKGLIELLEEKGYEVEFVGRV
jgi:hypothetical protein